MAGCRQPLAVNGTADTAGILTPTVPHVLVFTVHALRARDSYGGQVAGGAIFLSMYEYNGGGQTGVNSFIVIRNNTIHDVYGRDREAITTDGGFSAFLGVLAVVDGTSLTLGSDPVFVMDPTDGMQLVHSDWTGCAVYIMGGPGSGQWARDPRKAPSHTQRSNTIRCSMFRVLRVRMRWWWR